LDFQEVARILPWGMKPSAPSMGTLFLADYPKVSYPLFPYHEAALMIHVCTPLGEGRHCCWIIVDDDPALILGRELLGFPKKTGRFTFEEQEGNIRASVSRRGITVASIAAVRKESETAPLPVFDYKTFHIGGMGQFMAVSPIWLFRPKEKIHESYRAEVRLTIEESDCDPIKRMVAGDPQNGRIVVMDIPGDSHYLLPVGVAGPVWFGRTFAMRTR